MFLYRPRLSLHRIWMSFRLRRRCCSLKKRDLSTRRTRSNYFDHCMSSMHKFAHLWPRVSWWNHTSSLSLKCFEAFMNQRCQRRSIMLLRLAKTRWSSCPQRFLPHTIHVFRTLYINKSSKVFVWTLKAYDKTKLITWETWQSHRAVNLGNSTTCCDSWLGWRLKLWDLMYFASRLTVSEEARKVA